MGYREEDIEEYQYPEEQLKKVVGKKFKLRNVIYDGTVQTFFTAILVLDIAIFVVLTLIAYLFGFGGTGWHLIPMFVLMALPTFFVIGLGSELISMAFQEAKTFKVMQKQAHERGLM